MALKVLLISYNFPPLMRAGSLRTASWFKHFSEEIDITVITRKWDAEKNYFWHNYYSEDLGNNETEIISTHKKIIRVANKHNWFYKIKNNRFSQALKINKLCSLLEMFLKWTPLHTFENERGLYFAAKQLMLKEKFDVVVVSGEPFVTFKYAYQLYKQFETPYILDYRDPWIFNVFRRSGNKLGQIHIEKNQEQRFVKNAALVTSVSSKNIAIIRKNLANQNSDKFKIIPNGLDDELLELKKQFENYIGDEQVFVMTFIGTLYPQHQMVWILDAIESIIEDKEHTTQPIIKLVGAMNSCPDKHKHAIEHFRLRHPENIQIMPQMPQREAWVEMFKSDVLIKFNAFTQEENHFGKKLYEYAASEKSVISINCSEEMPKQSPFFYDKDFQFFCSNRTDIHEQIQSFITTKREKKQTKKSKISNADLAPFTNSVIVKSLEKLLLQHFSK